MIISFEEPQAMPPEETAYWKRVEKNARYHCENCGAFISAEQSKKCYWWTDYGWDYRPQCEQGKGCFK